MSPAREALPEAPVTIADVRGQPRYGTYQGEVPKVDLSHLSPEHQPGFPLRLFRRKRWAYLQASTERVLVAAAVADLGYTSNAFLTVVDLERERALLDEGFLGVPPTKVAVNQHPGPGLSARFVRPGVSFELSRPVGQDDAYLCSAKVGLVWPFERANLKVAIQPAGHPALTVISPVVGGHVNVTQKRAAMQSLGRLTLGSHVVSLDGAMSGMDYTHGDLARRTAWRWAMANGRAKSGHPLGLNLVEGFNDANEGCNENAIWYARQLYPVGRAHFRYDRARLDQKWEIETEDGAVKLSFLPLHVHREARDYMLVRSAFAQPLGLFFGELRIGREKVLVEALPGVTEDQDVLW